MSFEQPDGEHHSEAYSYPYSSMLAREVEARRRAGETIEEWVDPDVNLKELFRNIDGPIVELAGPTDIGHYYLDNIELPTRPLLTNITEGSFIAADRAGAQKLDSQLDLLLDGSHLEMPDDSVGMIIAVHVSAIDETGFDFSNFTAADDTTYRQRQNEADEAIRKIADGAEPTTGLIQKSLRLQFASEALRCLGPDGLYLADGSPTEKKAFERLGFRTLAYVASPDHDEPYYYMVLQKRSIEEIKRTK